MRVRYENWVNGLNGDWCISRQRFFGVPFPLWYPIDNDGAVDYSHPIVSDEARLPIDPSTDVPDGYRADQRDQPDGFAGDPDVMDTWATSSLTPQIVSGWCHDADLFARVFPMDLRPQAHDIIRTWLFSTVLRAHLEHGSLPWSHAALSGFVTDPDRKKMSKSKGNVVTPFALLEEHGSDGVRYWAAKGGPGVDTVFDAGQMKVGRRLAIKVLNASKFVLANAEPVGPITSPVDRAMLRNLAGVVDEATQALDRLRVRPRARPGRARVLGVLRRLPRVREGTAVRRAGPRSGRIGQQRAACRALGATFGCLPRICLLRPKKCGRGGRPGSVHRAAWPVRDELMSLMGDAADDDRAKWRYAREVLGEVRKRRSEAKQPLKVPIVRAVIADAAARLTHLDAIEADLRAAGRIDAIERRPAGELSVEVEFGTAPQA